MYRQHTSKLNIPLCIAGVLLCLTLFSFHLTSGLYARYTTTAAGSDNARVIAFGDISLTETGDFNADGKLVITPGVDITKSAAVTFEGSESATYVFVEVTAAGWSRDADNMAFSLIKGKKEFMHWGIADGWTYLPDTNHVYYRTLEPNTPLTEAAIIENGTITVSEEITAVELAAMGDVGIDLRASVVQAGGFDTPAAAWNSVSTKGG